MSERVVRLRKVAAGTDVYGNALHGESAEEIEPALYAPGSSQEAGGQVVVTAPALYWRDRWPDVREHDRLVVRGVIYEVDGVPADWRPAAAGGPGGLVARLRTVGTVPDESSSSPGSDGGSADSDGSPEGGNGES